ncbi:MAG: UbiA prenyltransferase family protein [Gaiellaceae bacterium MAG52_C11]|nr:UbiA prenyltransferase family protein [Candidatus Gaiellasilicea maunaloa]
MSLPESAAVVTPLQPRRRPALALGVALRPRQWSKNLLLFAGIVFAAEIGDPRRWLQAGAALLLYCAASSAAYLLNDLVDAPADRLHPVKRRRPLARGELTRRTAALAAGALALIAIVLAVSLGLVALGFLALFLAIQAAYTFGLKHVAIVDVMAIAGLFVIRAAAGADAVDVRISPWLLVCTALLALFLALGKRRGELVLVGAEATPGRSVLEGYSLALVDQLIGVVAGATIVAYAVYTLTARESQALAVTIPFVLFGILRYLLLLHRAGKGEEPENVLVTDVPILGTVAVWAAACAAILVWS